MSELETKFSGEPCVCEETPQAVGVKVMRVDGYHVTRVGKKCPECGNKWIERRFRER